ncbi:hypothetical protein [Microcoleus sp. FACHB-SPT15]|nr:hypothetical protein [Microcoleus sp. FACHB-SPT15]
MTAIALDAVLPVGVWLELAEMHRIVPGVLIPLMMRSQTQLSN